MKLYLDEDISLKVCEMLRKRRLDVVSAHETVMLEATDDEQLAFAAGEGRAMVTRNRALYVNSSIIALRGKPEQCE